MATKDRIRSATAKKNSTKQLSRLESLPVEINSIIFNSLDAKDISLHPISRPLLPYTRSVIFHTISISNREPDKLELLRESLFANPALVPLIKRLNLTGFEIESSDDEGQQYYTPWDVEEDQLVDRLATKRQMVSDLMELLMMTRLRAIHIEKWRKLSDRVLSSKFVGEAGGLLEIVELDRNGVTIEMISRLRVLPKLQTLLIIEDNLERTQSGDFTRFQDLGGFKKLHNIIFKLLDFDAPFSKALPLLFAAAPITTVELRQSAYSTFDCSAFLFTIPPASVKTVKLSGRQFLDSTFFDTILRFPLERLDILGPVGPDSNNTDPVSGSDSEDEENYHPRPTRSGHLDGLARMKTLKYFRYINSRLSVIDIKSFLSKVNAPFEFNVFSNLKVGKIGLKQTEQELRPGFGGRFSTGMEGWVYPTFGNNLSIEELEGLVERAEARGINIGENPRKALKVAAAYDREEKSYERAEEFMQPAWEAFLLAEQEYDRDDASRIHRAVSVESSVVEEDSSDSDLD